MNNSNSLFKRTEVIGRGKFGVVYKGYNKQTKQVVAIKVLNLDTQEEEVSDVQQEIQFLTELKNVPNVTHYYGSFLNDTKLWIIMDYCAGGSIRTLLKCGVFEERFIGVIARELLIALQSVHKLGVIHRDLKAANVLITKEGNVQLCDFGVAAQITSSSLKRTTMAGTPYWMAPEVIREGDAYNVKADIWSLGITMYEITTGNPPYSDKDAMWAMQMISKLTPPRLEGREYSLVLKEAIALCLDENPDERPLAEDLLKCRLVKLYKNHPSSILKELVTKYLLWRDQNSRRDSIAFLNLEEEQRQNNELSNQGGDGDLEEDESQLQIKWDFDSLSSREYIIENDIEIDKVKDSYNMSNSYVLDDDNSNSETFITDQSFLTRPGVSTVTTGTRSKLTNSSNTMITSTLTNGGASTVVPNASLKQKQHEIPKSLSLLFEDSAPSSKDTDSSIHPPSGLGLSSSERVDSPTIEIPDMDNLVNFSVAKQQQQQQQHQQQHQQHQQQHQHQQHQQQLSTNGQGSSSTSTLSIGRPTLNKPPNLYHTQSASGNLETRFSTTANRPRKKTISNTLGSAGSVNSSYSASTTPIQMASQSLQQSLQPQQQPLPPHTPPYTNTTLKTPSPKPIPSSGYISGLANTNSPSKSMKALQYNTNPLLQPINFKAPSGDQNMSINVTTTEAPTVASNGSGLATSSVSGGTSEPSSTTKKKRSRPGLHIQMPTPSSTLSNLSALTNNEFENQQGTDSNVNQFGINPLQATYSQMTMTPVAEKDAASLPSVGEFHDSETTTSLMAPARERTESISSTSLRYYGGLQPKKLGSTVASNPIFPTRSTSISASPINVKQPLRFPAIPAINSDFFNDSTPKQKLVNELDSMIKLFTQGLEALEDNI